MVAGADEQKGRAVLRRRGVRELPRGDRGLHPALRSRPTDGGDGREISSWRRWLHSWLALNVTRLNPIKSLRASGAVVLYLRRT